VVVVTSSFKSNKQKRMIRHIPKKNIAQHERWEHVLLPISVDTTCSFCRRNVNFSINWNQGRNEAVIHTYGHCPACRARVRFILIIDDRDQVAKSGDLFIVPGSDMRVSLPGLEENVKLQQGLKQAYESAINVFNAREWTATSVLCRRVLEGISKSILPAEKRQKPLARQIEDLAETLDLNKPIVTLGDAIRKGGNLGAHFDLEKEPNAEICELMLDLLDYLIEYAFILPERINSLHDKIEALGTVEPPTGTPQQ
jgi:Domain of unknown function (DUF4145)